MSNLPHFNLLVRVLPINFHLVIILMTISAISHQQIIVVLTFVAVVSAGEAIEVSAVRRRRCGRYDTCIPIPLAQLARNLLESYWCIGDVCGGHHDGFAGRFVELGRILGALCVILAG